MIGQDKPQQSPEECLGAEVLWPTHEATESHFLSSAAHMNINAGARAHTRRDRQTDRHTHTHTDTQTQTGRQTDRQTHTHTHT